MVINLEELSVKVNDFAKKNVDFLCNLKDRWHEESEYEDFNDYVEVINKKVKESNLELESLNRSFTLTFKAIDGKVRILVNESGISVETITN